MAFIHNTHILLWDTIYGSSDSMYVDFHSSVPRHTRASMERNIQEQEEVKRLISAVSKSYRV